LETLKTVRNIGRTMGSETDTAEPAVECFIVEDNPAVARFIARALADFGVTAEQFSNVPALADGLTRAMPRVIFLDISLGDSDAIDAIRALSAAGFSGTVQVMSGSNTGLLADVRQVGERHGLRMRQPLNKPFRIDAVKQIVEEEHLGGTHRPAADPVALENHHPVRARGSAPEIALGEALERNWVELWYQPKFSLTDGRLVGAEGLARVRHPELGLLSPGSFIPNASHTELMALTEFALRTSLRDAADFAFVGHDIRFAINVPVEALMALPIPSIVRECRPRGDDWSGIILEVTEDQVIRDIPTVHEIATQLRIYRIALAIDDFGLGYSSLARLKELPFAELKLDQSFVQNCGDDPTNAALCRTVVELAHRFGGVAVAEGIEKASDLAVIRRTGCDVGQGYMFAHPMPKEFLMTRLMAGETGGFNVLSTERAGADSKPRMRA
jgi:EAL domain-containing protein (putative c-di-GMP-specific phosphodiesterase class I)/ActR/RegA family two-component response regulator